MEHPEERWAFTPPFPWELGICPMQLENWGRCIFDIDDITGRWRQHLPYLSLLPISYRVSHLPGYLFLAENCFHNLWVTEHGDCTANNINIQSCANLPPKIGTRSMLYKGHLKREFFYHWTSMISADFRNGWNFFWWVVWTPNYLKLPYFRCLLV